MAVKVDAKEPTEDMAAKVDAITPSKTENIDQYFSSIISKKQNKET